MGGAFLSTEFQNLSIEFFYNIILLTISIRVSLIILRSTIFQFYSARIHKSVPHQILFVYCI